MRVFAVRTPGRTQVVQLNDLRLRESATSVDLLSGHQVTHGANGPERISVCSRTTLGLRSPRVRSVSFMSLLHRGLDQDLDVLLAIT